MRARITILYAYCSVVMCLTRHYVMTVVSGAGSSAGDSLLSCHLFCVPLRGTRHLCGDWPVDTVPDLTDKESVAGRPGFWGREGNGATESRRVLTAEREIQ